MLSIDGKIVLLFIWMPTIYHEISGNRWLRGDIEQEDGFNFDWEDDACLIRFYKVQYYGDPTPYEFDGIQKPFGFLKEKSIKVFGKCCWKVFK